MSKPEAKLESVTQTVDLSQLVGADISSDPVLVRKIGQGIIDYMDKRVEDGLGLGRKKLLSPYSKDYSDSLNFKAAGKSKSHVNMRLTGSMMSSIDLLEEDGNTIRFGIEGSDAPKAFNHQTGDTVPKREFFGVTDDEIKKFVLPEFKKDIEAKKTTSTQAQDKLINSIRGIRTLADFLKQ